MSKAIQIRDEVVRRLTTPPINGIGAGGINVDPDYAFEMRDLPIIAVYLGDGKNVSAYASGSFTDREVHLNVRCITRGDDPLAGADQILDEAYSRIMTNPSLSGLAVDIMDGATTRQKDVLESPVGITEINFLVSYQTGTATL